MGRESEIKSCPKASRDEESRRTAESAEPHWPPHLFFNFLFLMSDFAKELQNAAPIQSYNVGGIVAGTVVVSNQKMILVDLEGQFTGIITGNCKRESLALELSSE